MFFQFLRVFISKRSFLIFLSFHYFTSSLRRTLASNFQSCLSFSRGGCAHITAQLPACGGCCGFVAVTPLCHCGVCQGGLWETSDRRLSCRFCFGCQSPRPSGKPHAGVCERWKQASSLERRPAGAGLVISWFFLDKAETVSLLLVTACASGWPTEELDFSPSCPSAHALLGLNATAGQVLCVCS